MTNFIYDSDMYHTDFCQTLEEKPSNVILSIVFPTLILLVGNIITIYQNSKLEIENRKLKNIIKKIFRQ